MPGWAGPDGVGEQETGKTSAAELITAPAGGCLNLEIQRRRRGPQGDSIRKQLISDVAAGYRCALLDNVELVDDDELAELVTAKVIHGRASHLPARVNKYDR